MTSRAILAMPTNAARYVGVQVVAVPVSLAVAAWLMRETGWDLRVQDMFFDPVIHAFPWRRQPLLEGVGHDLLKMLPIGIGLMLLFAAIAAPWVEPLRRWRTVLWTTLAAQCLGPGVITALKQITAAHCPWDLVRYGGYAAYTHDWFATSAADAGRCLPSGHAGAGFSLFALSFAGWASGIARWRWTGLLIAVSAGIVFSAVRTVQGAHFVSHSLWAAAIDWGCVSLAFLPLFCMKDLSASLARA